MNSACREMMSNIFMRRMCHAPLVVVGLVVGLLVGLLVTVGSTYAATENTHSSPNILMILTDDQGWGDVAAYGAKDLKTPAIDSLIASGMRFDNFYANCPVCSPTRAALLSGMVPDLSLIHI